MRKVNTATLRFATERRHASTRRVRCLSTGLRRTCTSSRSTLTPNRFFDRQKPWSRRTTRTRRIWTTVSRQREDKRESRLAIAERYLEVPFLEERGLGKR